MVAVCPIKMCQTNVTIESLTVVHIYQKNTTTSYFRKVIAFFDTFLGSSCFFLILLRHDTDTISKGDLNMNVAQCKNKVQTRAKSEF